MLVVEILLSKKPWRGNLGINTANMHRTDWLFILPKPWSEKSALPFANSILQTAAAI